MKQSNNKKSRDVTAFLYERLSRDDNLEGESYSIGNQKKLLAKLRSEIEKQSSRSMTTDMYRSCPQVHQSEETDAPDAERIG